MTRIASHRGDFLIGLIIKMLLYEKKLKPFSRSLRNNSTEAEKLLWFYLRRKQLCNVQFYRQKPIGNYIKKSRTQSAAF